MDPIGAIKRAPRFRLARDQIAQAICQIRFSPILRIATDDEAIALFQESIRAEYPRYAKQAGMGIIVTPDGIQHQQTQDPLHRFQDTNELYAVTLAPEFVALETSNYVDIDDFAARIDNLCQAVSSQYKPAEMTRLGLRFINEFRLGSANSTDRLTEVLTTGFLGASGASELTTALVSSQHVLELAGGNTRMLVRHGLYPDGGTTAEMRLPTKPPDPVLQQPFYLLDIDVFSEVPLPFSTDGIGANVREYNELIRSFFAWAVNESYRRQELGQEDLS